MNTMTPRERLWASVNHREADRIPIDFGSTLVTSISLSAYAELLRYLRAPQQGIVISDYVQRLAFVDEPILERFAVDTRMVQPFPRREPEVREDADAWIMVDGWGSTWRMPKEKGHYFDLAGFPLSDCSLDTLLRYPFPVPDGDETVSSLTEHARNLYESTDYALVASVIEGGGISEQAAWLMGYERYYQSFVLEKQLVDTLMSIITDLYVEQASRYLQHIGKYIQVFVFWDDLGGQNAPLISPQMYRELIKPKHQRLVDCVKAKSGAKFFLHSCGAVRELIPDFIEIGVDILNPVQFSAAGMELTSLKRDFGQEITFWGGTCDPQSTLPFGTPQEVREEARRAVDILAPGGGFVFSPIHNIQSYVPPENIVSLFDAVIHSDRA